MRARLSGSKRPLTTYRSVGSFGVSALFFLLLGWARIAGGQEAEEGDGGPERDVEVPRASGRAYLPPHYRDRVPHGEPEKLGLLQPSEDDLVGGHGRLESAPEGEPPGHYWAPEDRFHTCGYFPHYVPWYIPQAYPYKQYLYPSPVAHEPHLGLRYSHPYAWQMGLRVPRDTDPLDLADLPPYVGLVGAIKAALADEEAARALHGGPGENEAIALMRRGLYRQAGKLLARRFERAAHPRYALLLSEVFFALRRYRPAELLLTHAFGDPGVADVLEADVSGHFASKESFTSQLAEVAASGEHAGLAAYFLLHSGRQQDGRELLRASLEKSPGDALLTGLHRRHSASSF